MTAAQEKTARLAIYLKAFGVAVVYVLAVWLVDRLFIRRYVNNFGLSVGLAFSLVQIVVIAILMEISLSIKFVRHIRQQRSNGVCPGIRDRLATHLGGDDQRQALRKIQKRYGRDVEECVVDLLSAVQGVTLDRISELAVSLGLVERWRKQYASRDWEKRRRAISRLGLLTRGAPVATLIAALADEQDTIKLEASRALIRSGGTRELEHVFYAATDHSALVCSILTESLRPHALLLCERVIPAALSSSEPRRIVVTLQMVKAWGKSLPLPDLGAVLGHSDPDVRAAALLALPLNAAPQGLDLEIRKALEDANENVRAAAAVTAGRLKLAPAVPSLQRCLAQAGAAALSAAYALAEIGPTGLNVLEAEILGGGRGASVSLEALEQVKTSRFLMIGV